MPKVLICASTASHINHFHLPYLRYFNEKGYEIHVAVPDPENVRDADFTHILPMAKSFFSPKNITAILKLKNLLSKGRYDAVMTHATLASAIGRVALLLAGKGETVIICTVHGYLFWNGCGFLKRLIYYTPELLLRGATDFIVTMNSEDVLTARKLVKKGGRCVNIRGMGIDETRFSPVNEDERKAARRALSISDHAFVIVYAAEFSKRKNHSELLNAMVAVVRKNKNTLLLLCGEGALCDEAEALSKSLKISSNVRFLGYRSDMRDIYGASDLSVSSSKSEGLPFNISEAQLCALPVVASAIRGHTDLIEDGENGLLYPSGDAGALAEAINRVSSDTDFAKKLGLAASESAKRFSLSSVFEENAIIYEELINSNAKI